MNSCFGALGTAIIILLVLILPAFAGPTPFSALYTQFRKEVLAASPELRRAQAVSDQNRAAQHTAWTRWLPRADLQLRQSRTKDYSLLTSGQLGNLEQVFPGGFVPVQTPLASWSLNVNFPIFNRGIQLGIQTAQANQELSEAQLNQKLSELDWNLRDRLGAYFFQLYRIHSVQASIELARGNLREARLKLSLGEKTRVDVLRASASLQSLESSLLNDQQGVTTALRQLQEFSGLNRERIQELLPPDRYSSEAEISHVIEELADSKPVRARISEFLPTRDSSGYARKLTDRLPWTNPAYRSLVAEEAAAQVRARTLMNDQWPELLLQGNLNKQSPDWGSTLSGGNVSHTITLVLNIPLFNSGAVFSTLSEKRNAELAAMIKRQQDANALRDELENLGYRIESIERLIRAQQSSVAQTEELLRLSQRTYRLGKTTLLELLSAQTEWVDAKLNLAQSRIQYSTLVHQFAASLGVNTE